MPRMGVSTESLKGMPTMPQDIYTVRLDGFEPRFSKDRGSVNLNPKLVVINHPTLNDRRVFDNLNSKAGWIQLDFCHAFGLPMLVEGDTSFIPGEFQGPDNDPERWSYVGPLTGRLAKAEVAEVDNQRGGTRNAVKRYICAVAGCSTKHSDNLVG